MVAVNPILWGIHSMDDFLFLNQNLIALGWEEMEDLSSLPQSRDAFKERYMAAFPNAKKGAVANSAGMLYRFVWEMKEGDYIVFPSKMDRKINLGVVTGPYYHVAGTRYPNRRKVKWL